MPANIIRFRSSLWGLLFISFLCSISNAQDQVKVDSLLAILPLEDDALNANLYKEIANEYHYIDNQAVEIYVKLQLEYAEKSGVDSLIVDAQEHAANVYSELNDTEACDYYYDLVIQDAIKKGDNIKACNQYMKWGTIYCDMGLYEDGMQKFQEGYVY